MKKHLIGIISILIFVVSFSWYNETKEKEPLIALLSSIIGLIVYFSIIRSEILQLFHNVKFYLRSFLKRNELIEKIRFNTIDSDNRIIKHILRLEKIWEETNSIYQLTHKSSDIGINTIATYEDCHSFEISNEDINNDGIQEILVKYHTGAHTSVLNVFKLEISKRYNLISGGEIGSDWSDIDWKKDELSNKFEIFSSNRDWSSEDMVKVTDCYQVNCDRIEKRPTTKAKFHGR